METLRGLLLTAATIAMGLSAGLFYTFACAVMPGLRRTDDRTFVGVMQRINVAILNGWFALSFAGSMVLAVLAGAFLLSERWRPVLPWVVAAVVLYGVVLAVTFAVNVPLNNAIDAAGEPDSMDDPAAVRERFEDRWVSWNVVRAVVGTAGFGCLAWALVTYGRIAAGG